MAGSPLQALRGNLAPGSPCTPGSPARCAAASTPGSPARAAGQLFAVRILECDIHAWSDRVRERIGRAQRGVLEGEEAGVQILGEARHGREMMVPLQRFLLHPVERPSTGLGCLSRGGREHAGRSNEEPRQKAMADTHMAVTLLTCLANKIDLKALERIAMRDMGRTLRTLVLEDCSISDDDIPFLAAGLARVAGNETVCKVRTLALTNNYITAKGTAALAQALNVSSSLQELYLDWNKCGAEGCRHLAEALVHNTSLSLLHLEANDVRDRGITHLAKMLRTNSTLTDLNLATDNIGKSGAGALGQMLLVNGHLESLNLNGNSIGSQGASEIARALEHGNTRLESLSLDCTEIGEEFYLVLAQALRSPSCPLRLLSASRNNAGDKGAHAVAYALTCNKVLSQLRLSSCGISHDCVRSMLELAGSVGNLVELDLGNNGSCQRSTFLLNPHRR